MNDQSFGGDKVVLLTGATGYIGKNILKKKLEKINIAFLKQLPEYQEASESWKKEKTETNVIESETIVTQTPEEILENSYQSIRKNLSKEILSSVKNCSPTFFERLVVELLVKIGYGGSLADAGKAIGKSGDGGIDGIIKEDKLGLDTIYLQAKRWESSIPIKEIRDFAGSLLSKKAKKGIFITTSSFPQSAYEYVSTIDPKIILIDEVSTQFMFTLSSFPLKKEEFTTYKKRGKNFPFN